MAVVEQRSAYGWRVGFKAKQPDGSWKWERVNHHFPKGTPQAKQEAAIRKIAEDFEQAEKSDAINETESYTISSFAEIYMNEYVKPMTSANNYKTLKSLLDKHILPQLGGMRMDRIRPMDITRYLNKLRTTAKSTTAISPEKRKRKPTQEEIAHYEQTQNSPTLISERTVLHHYTTLKAMFAKAVQWQLLENNPLDKVDRPKKIKKKMKTLNMQQAISMLCALAQEENITFRVGVLLALMGGLRLGEVDGLYFTDLNEETGEIDIARAQKYTPEEGNFLGDPKSESGKRLVSLPLFVVEFILEVKSYHAILAEVLGDRWRGDGRIICSWDGSPLHHDTLSKQWRKFADKNKLEGYVFHELRHSHATILLACNVDAVTVAARLGHADAETTLKEYAHVFREHDTISTNILQGLFGSPSGPIDLIKLKTKRPPIRTLDGREL